MVQIEIIKITISREQSTMLYFYVCTLKTNNMKAINFIILMLILFGTACNNRRSKSTLGKNSKKQNIDETYRCA